MKLISEHSVFGRQAEEKAVAHLLSLGYLILERNFRCRMGELDIIARDGRCLVFVEVKARRRTDFGQPFEAVNFIKANRLRRLAQNYLKYRYQTVDILSRFDVISIVALGEGPWQVQHLVNVKI